MITIWTRVNTLLLVLVLLALVALVGVMATRSEGGSLDPPGPPGGTAGVLEPGTPISALPFTIDTPGYYYLTATLHLDTDGVGITINSSDVTLDLKGFNINGTSGSSHGIEVPGSASAITIRNGSVSSWGGSGIEFSAPQFADGSALEDLHVYNNGDNGIRAGNLARITDVTATNNGLIGIRANRDAVIQRCTSTNNGGDGIFVPFNAVISDCAVRDNDGDGINAGQGSLVTNNVVQNSGGDGVQIANNTRVEANQIFLSGVLVNDGAGVHATGNNVVIRNNSLMNNDRGVWTEAGGLVVANVLSNGDNVGFASFGTLVGPLLDYLTIDDAGVNPHANFVIN